MKKTILSVTIVIMVILSSVVPAQAETMKAKVSCYMDHNESIPVGDVQGHFLGIYSRKGLAFFEKGEVATFSNWGMSDRVKGKATWTTYIMFTFFEDGATVVAKVLGTTDTDPKGLQTYKASGDFTQGTGRFEGIKGTINITGKSYTVWSKEKGAMSDAALDVTGTYTLTLPRK